MWREIYNVAYKKEGGESMRTRPPSFFRMLEVAVYVFAKP